MAVLYVIAYVPAAAKRGAEAAVAPYLQSPNKAGIDTFRVPLSPTGSGTPTAYGLCGPAHDTADLVAALPSLKAALGGDYQTVPAGSYSLSRDWLAWLAARGLKPVAPKAMT